MPTAHTPSLLCRMQAHQCKKYPWKYPSKEDPDFLSLGNPEIPVHPSLPPGMYQLSHSQYILAKQSSITRARTSPFRRAPGEYTPTAVGGLNPLSSFSNVPYTNHVQNSHENDPQGAKNDLGIVSHQIPGQENVPSFSFHDECFVHNPYSFALNSQLAKPHEISADFPPLSKGAEMHAEAHYSQHTYGFPSHNAHESHLASSHLGMQGLGTPTPNPEVCIPYEPRLAGRDESQTHSGPQGRGSLLTDFQDGKVGLPIQITCIPATGLPSKAQKFRRGFPNPQFPRPFIPLSGKEEKSPNEVHGTNFASRCKKRPERAKLHQVDPDQEFKLTGVHSHKGIRPDLNSTHFLPCNFQKKHPPFNQRLRTRQSLLGCPIRLAEIRGGNPLGKKAFGHIFLTDARSLTH